MRRTRMRIWLEIGSLLLAVGMLVGCVITDQLSQQMPLGSRCTFTCPSDKVLASETSLGGCTVYVVDNMCVATINPGGCKGDPKGYKVLLQNQSGSVVEVRNEAMQKGKWGAHWGEKKEVKPGSSYEWGIASTHGTGVRFVCP